MDAAVWNLDEVEEKQLAFYHPPLTRERAAKAARDDTVAVLVTNAADADLAKLLRRCLNFAAIQRVQEQVMGRRFTSILNFLE